jgi:glycine oxidase
VTPDLVVVGAGIVGLSVAWRALGAGLTVTVIDPAPGQGASRVAAGMLAPVTEARAAEAPLTRLGLESARRWPAFAEQLADDAGGADLGLRREGTLQVAFDDDDRRALDELAGVLDLLGLDAERLGGRDCRKLVPLLAPRVRAGLLARGDWQVDPRRAVGALLVAVERRGGTLRAGRAVGLLQARAGRSRVGQPRPPQPRPPRSRPAGAQADGRATLEPGPAGPVAGVSLADGTTVEAGAVVLAAGTALAEPAGSIDGLHLPVRPVKGEILRLAAKPAGCALPLTIRATVQGRVVYLVPRADGETVVGATVEEAGFDRSVRAGAVSDLLRAAIDLVPAVAEYPLVEATAGLRPATPDNAPLIGPTAVAGLHVAGGHYRNGVLLAPITADLVLAGLEQGRLPAEAAAFSAGRFT